MTNKIDLEKVFSDLRSGVTLSPKVIAEILAELMAWRATFDQGTVCVDRVRNSGYPLYAEAVVSYRKYEEESVTEIMQKSGFWKDEPETSVGPKNPCRLASDKECLAAGIGEHVCARGACIKPSFEEFLAKGRAKDKEAPIPVEEKCAHCGRVPQGYGRYNGERLCHPDVGLDCYDKVTVYNHPMPCEACREILGREIHPTHVVADPRTLPAPYTALRCALCDAIMIGVISQSTTEVGKSPCKGKEADLSIPIVSS